MVNISAFAQRHVHHPCCHYRFLHTYTPQIYDHSCNAIQTYYTFNSALHILFWPARPLIHFIRFFPHHAYYLTSKIYTYL